MSEPTHNDAKNGHGTTWTYIIGFILSLVFTINAYILVVNKMVSGTALLTTILAFAVLQMAVQIFFFLHLGRGPKPLYNVTFFVGTVGLILVVVVGSIFIMNNLHYNMAPLDSTKKLAQDEAIYQVGGVNTGACQVTHENHKVTIEDDKISPVHVNALLCDTLTFINKDSKVHTIAFGPYPQHQSYAGESDQAVHKGFPITVTLNQTGAYIFHDTLDSQVTGDFKVTQ